MPNTAAWFPTSKRQTTWIDVAEPRSTPERWKLFGSHGQRPWFSEGINGPDSPDTFFSAISHGDSMGAVDLQLSAADCWLGQLSITTGDAADPPYQTRSCNGRRASDKGLLELTLDQYLDLLEWIGRQIGDNKSGAIPNHLAPILERLKIRGDHWLDLIQNFDRWFSNFVGHIDRLQQSAARSGRLWVRGARQCAAAFLS